MNRWRLRACPDNPSTPASFPRMRFAGAARQFKLSVGYWGKPVASEVDTARLSSYIDYNVYPYILYAQNQCGQYANGSDPGRTPGKDGPTPWPVSERDQRVPGRGRLATGRVCLHGFP